MVLEHLMQGEPGAWKVVFRADADELARALAAAPPPPAGRSEPPSEEDALADAVNRAILAPDGFDPIWRQAVEQAGLEVLTDPDFRLTALNRAEGFRAEAVFYALPPLTLGRYTGFTQAVEPRPIRRLAIELEINQRHGDEERAAAPAGKAELRRRVAAELYRKRCQQAEALARRKLILQLGDEVSGPLPRQLVGENYFAEQRRFHLSLQAQGVSFDQFLQVRGQTVEQFRAEMHAEAERKLRSRLGLLLVADKEALWPDAAAVDAALAAWDERRDGAPTFPANDRRKARQKLASARAEEYILAHSTLLPPPAEPVVTEGVPPVRP